MNKIKYQKSSIVSVKYFIEVPWKSNCLLHLRVKTTSHSKVYNQMPMSAPNFPTCEIYSPQRISLNNKQTSPLTVVTVPNKIDRYSRFPLHCCTGSVFSWNGWLFLENDSLSFTNKQPEDLGESVKVTLHPWFISRRDR